MCLVTIAETEGWPARKPSPRFPRRRRRCSHGGNLIYQCNTFATIVRQMWQNRYPQHTKVAREWQFVWRYVCHVVVRVTEMWDMCDMCDSECGPWFIAMRKCGELFPQLWQLWHVCGHPRITFAAFDTCLTTMWQFWFGSWVVIHNRTVGGHKRQTCYWRWPMVTKPNLLMSIHWYRHRIFCGQSAFF